MCVYNFRRSDSNAYYRGLGGVVARTVTQTPYGCEQEVDVFAFDIRGLLDSLATRPTS
jgi:hypothetical protein